jgi:hypothetical protein
MHTSEDSSEVAFLLVGKRSPSFHDFEHPTNISPENYQLTAPVGLRIGREFLDTSGCHQSSFSSVGFASCKALEKRVRIEIEVDACQAQAHITWAA